MTATVENERMKYNERKRYCPPRTRVKATVETACYTPQNKAIETENERDTDKRTETERARERMRQRETESDR